MLCRVPSLCRIASSRALHTSVPVSLPSRDLLGYGAKRPQIKWPDGRSIAFSPIIYLTEGAELSVEDGYDVNASWPSFYGVGGASKGQRDIRIEQLHNFGSRVGIHRLLNAFDEAKLPATVMVCGRTAERCPELIKSIVERGFEIACHSYRWIPHCEFDDASREYAEITKAVEAIEKASGKRPVGFSSKGSPSVNTRSLLQKTGFLYDVANDDELPYYDTSSDLDAPMLVLPVSPWNNDLSAFMYDTTPNPELMFSHIGEALDVALEEAQNGSTQVMTVGFHPFLSGRPPFNRYVESVLELLSEAHAKEIWVAPMKEIATYWKEHNPPPKR